VKPKDIERVRLSTDPKDPLFRTVVRRGVNELYEIGEEELTSRAPTGKVTERRIFVLTHDQAAWLHGALGEVLAAVHEEQRELAATLDDERRRLRAACEMALKTQMHPASKESVALREALEGGDGKVVRLKAGKR
jgi:hypothetical protein